MKKALLAALCFIVVGFALVSGTFATPDLDKIFADLTAALGQFGLPERGGAGTLVHVTLSHEDSAETLYPGSTASRTVTVINQGSGDVYCRLVYALQYDKELWENLTISFTAGAGYKDEGLAYGSTNGWEDGWKPIKIDGVDFRMRVFTYTGSLASNAKTAPVKISISMNTQVTSAQMDRLRSDFLQVQVLAIDPTRFVDNNNVQLPAETALDMALPLDTLNPF